MWLIRPVCLCLLTLTLVACDGNSDIAKWVQKPGEFRAALKTCELAKNTPSEKCRRVFVMAEMMQQVQHLSAAGASSFAKAEQHVKDLDQMHQAGQISDQAWQGEEAALNQRLQSSYEVWQFALQEHIGQWMMAAQTEVAKLQAERPLNAQALAIAKEKVQILYAILRQLISSPG